LTKNDEESSVGGSAVSNFPKLTPETSNHHYLNEKKGFSDTFLVRQIL
jgi:hypothetical protein